MKILQLELIDYERFSLRGIREFKINFKEILQLILGSNGAGKSSLLEQLTPLPPDPKDFLKSGKKKIIIDHNGNIYTLTSVFSPKVEHSFIINNETELNDGGTITVQKDLVKQHFGITSDIHELILGVEKFSSMSFSRRKEWFIKLCDTNYDYAIKVFNKLKDRHRDITGAIKLAKKRLVIETEKLIKQDEEEKLIEEIRQLHNTLNILLEIRKPVEKDIDNILLDQENIDKTLIKYSNTLSDLINQVNNESLNIDEIDSLIKQSDMEIFSLSNHISRLMEEHKDNSSKITILQRAEEATIDSIKTDINNLSKESNIFKQNIIIEPISNAHSYLNILDSIKVNLIDIFNNIPINKDKKYSQEQLNNSKVKLEGLIIEKNNINSNLNDLYTKIKHMENHKDNPDTECPSCKYKFSLNYNPSILNGWKKKALELEQRLNSEVEKSIRELESYIEDCTTYSHYYRQYIQLNRSWSGFSEYWNYLNSNQIVSDNPRYGITLINLIENDIQNQIKIEEISNTIKEKKDLLSSIEQVGGADLTTLINRNSNIDSELESLTNKQTKFVNQRKEYVNRKSVILSVEDLSKKIKSLMYEKRDLHKDHLESLRRIHFNNAIRELQSYLASKENILNNFSLQKSLAEDISFQIVQLEKNEKALSYLMSTLSPTEGMIAEGLLGFINVFVSQMNHFIKKIWTYPLVIKTCGIAEGDNIDIDYKFPLVVGNNRDKPVQDISKGSTGMLEIINLAFRITAMQYLGLSKYPLSLDEWGSGFDTAHREQAINAIKSLVDQNIFEQLFIISHYAESYGALSNPDICVLDDTNITLPKLNSKVNQNVIIN